MAGGKPPSKPSTERRQHGMMAMIATASGTPAVIDPILLQNDAKQRRLR
jgi:hypothetical protein